MENKVFLTHGELIKWKREQLNFSIDEMANYLNISKEVYKDYEENNRN